jgi:hypothetical protein
MFIPSQNKLVNRRATLKCLSWFIICCYCMALLQVVSEFQERKVLQLHKVESKIRELEMQHRIEQQMNLEGRSETSDDDKLTHSNNPNT